MQTIYNWYDIFILSARGSLEGVLIMIPNILVSILLMLVGWLIAKLLQRLTYKLLKLVGIEKLSEKSGINNFLKSSGFSNDILWIFSRIVFWGVILLFLLSVSDILGFKFFADMINSILIYLPNIIIALLILIVGTWAAKLLSGIVKGGSQRIGLQYAEMLGSIVNVIVILLSFIIALSQLNIDASILSNILLIVVAALSLGIAVAFSFGARGILSNVIAGIYIMKNFKTGDEIKTREFTCKLIEHGSIASLIEIDDKKLRTANSLLIESF